MNERWNIRNRCRCDELSTVANEICDGMTSAGAADQSQPSSSDVATATPDVAVATSDVTTATPDAPPSTPAAVEDVESNHEVIPTRSPGNVLDVNGTVITAEEMNMAELKVRIACQEKANQALRMELKCAELQVTNNIICSTSLLHLVKYTVSSRISGIIQNLE